MGFLFGVLISGGGRYFRMGGQTKSRRPKREAPPPPKKNDGRSRATSRLRLWSTVETYTRQLTYELTAPFKSAAAPLTVQQGRPCQVTSKNATLLPNPSCLFQNARRPSSEFWGATAPLPPPPSAATGPDYKFHVSFDQK